MTVSRSDLERLLERLRRGTRDPRAGVFGPDSMLWHVNRESIAFMGGGRAALLQLAHPYVAHAIEQHSNTRTDLLGRFVKLADDDTVVVVASALGQKPYTHDLYPEGKICLKFKDVRQVLDIVGAKGVGDVVPVMDPQWNVRISDPTERARVRDALLAVRRENAPTPDAINQSLMAGPIIVLYEIGIVCARLFGRPRRVVVAEPVA